MRPRRKRRRSLWLILFVLLIIIVFNASNWYIYSKIKFYLTWQLGERLANIASATAFGLDASSVSKAREDQQAHEEIKQLLNNVKEDNQLVDAFILDQDYNNVLSPPSDSVSDVFLHLDLAAITQALAGSKAYSHLYQVGDYFFESGFAPIYDSDGEVIGVLGVEAGADFFKVLSSFKRTLIGAFILSLLVVLVLGVVFYNLTTHVRRMEEAVIKTSALQAMGEMVATICHEIRNPLGIIKGTSERLRSKYDQIDDELFDFIPEEVDRLNDILTGYLEFASSEPKRKERVDIVPLVARTADQLRRSFSKKNIEIELNAGENLPLLSVNPGGIRQVLINLLMNAKDAVKQDGLISVSLKSEKEFVELSVEDNGKGISRQELKQIFNPFFSTKAKGSGLGLYVVKKIVEEHDGKTGVERKAEGGTKIKVRFPVRSARRSTDLS
ncbi:MAG: ATP-binding protein [Candidatus Zixiibacteriota bacterium]